MCAFLARLPLPKWGAFGTAPGNAPRYPQTAPVARDNRDSRQTGEGSGPRWRGAASMEGGIIDTLARLRVQIERASAKQSRSLQLRPDPQFRSCRQSGGKVRATIGRHATGALADNFVGTNSSEFAPPMSEPNRQRLPLITLGVIGAGNEKRI